MKIKARWIIVAVSAALFYSGSIFASLRDPWFQSLNRPDWLTFEVLIPFIWFAIWVCLTWSAVIVWEKVPYQSRGLLMVPYGAIALFTSLYSYVVDNYQSLLGGLTFGALATLLVYLIAAIVWPISRKASLLLLPYMLWGPVGTYLTWLLIQLNPIA